MSVATLLALGRVSNLPTVWTNVLAAAVLAGATSAPGSIAATALAMSLMYCGGMFLNDAFDRSVDAIERPERPIPSGRAAASTVFTLGGLQLASGVGMLTAVARAGAISPWPALVSGISLTAAIVAYDVFHKSTPLAPWLMGLCRALVYVGAGAALTAEPRWHELTVAALALATYTAGVTGVAAVESTGRASRTWPLSLVTVAVVSVPLVAGTLSALLPAAVLAAWSAHALSRSVRPRSPDVPGGVVRAIAGMCLLDASWIWVYGSRPAALLAALGVPLTRLAQRRVAGT